MAGLLISKIVVLCRSCAFAIGAVAYGAMTQKIILTQGGPAILALLYPIVGIKKGRKPLDSWMISLNKVWYKKTKNLLIFKKKCLYNRKSNESVISRESVELNAIIEVTIENWTVMTRISTHVNSVIPLNATP